MAASISNLKITLGGKERQFGLLSVEDLVELTSICPEPNGELVNIGTLDRWAMHPTGCVHFLLKAAQHLNPKLAYEEVATWGSVYTRANAAKQIYHQSVLSGEENLIPKATGEGGETTGSTPSSSESTPPPSGTPGT